MLVSSLTEYQKSALTGSIVLIALVVCLVVAVFWRGGGKR